MFVWLKSAEIVNTEGMTWHMTCEQKIRIHDRETISTSTVK